MNVCFDRRTELIFGIQYCFNRDYPEIIYPGTCFFFDSMPSYCDRFYQMYGKGITPEFEEYIRSGGLDSYGRTVDIVLSMNSDYQVSDTPEVRAIAKANPLFNLEKLNAFLKEFTDKAEYEGFCDLNQQVYDIAASAYMEVLNANETSIDRVLEDFYGYSLGEMKVILCSFISGCFGMQREGELINVSKYKNIGDENSPQTDPRFIIISCLHEFSHPYVNPMTEKYLSNTELTNFFEDSQTKGLDGCYNNQFCLVNEYLIRAIQFYFAKSFIPEESLSPLIEWHISGMGYTHLENLMLLLNKRSEYSSFEEFYAAEIVEFFASVEEKTRLMKVGALKMLGSNIFKTDINKVERINFIYQLSDMPDKVIDSEEDCYIGYEDIGEGYSGKNGLVLIPRCVEASKVIAEYVKDGVLLDLACGDGAYTLPCAQLGVNIIAGDISNKMMTLMQKRAEKNSVSLENVVLCRMNALEIPLKDESVDCVIANSMLHLISRPEKVVNEIFRVLKKGGKFICFDDAPGRDKNEANDYMDAIGEIHRRYWEYLGKLGIKGKRYSWKFDRNGYCETMFSKEERIISWNREYVETVDSAFLPRMAARGFSDQAAVPEKEHKEAWQYALDAADKRFGEGWRKFSATFMESDIIVTVFTK